MENSGKSCFKRRVSSDEILRRLVNCDILPKSNIFLFNSLDQTAEDFLALTFANVWFSMMKNYTVMSDLLNSRYSCTNGEKFFDSESLSKFAIRVRSVNLVGSFVICPYLFTDKINNLRFVTCGWRGVSSLAFSELISVFDGATWTILFGCMIAITIPICSYSMRNDHVNKILIILKLLLEQSGPFHEEKWVNEAMSLRLVIGTALLMGIVVSNSYI